VLPGTPDENGFMPSEDTQSRRDDHMKALYPSHARLFDRPASVTTISDEDFAARFREFASSKNEIIGKLYAVHDEVNKRFYGGKLSVPVIIIERLHRRVLGHYVFDRNGFGALNEIKINSDFAAANDFDRIVLTFKHEMIHQAQGEIFYRHAERPKSFHNKLFREEAARIGIPAEGRSCSSGPAGMPPPKYKTRRWKCRCGNKLYTRKPLEVTCNVCGQDYEEF